VGWCCAPFVLLSTCAAFAWDREIDGAPSARMPAGPLPAGPADFGPRGASIRDAPAGDRRGVSGALLDDAELLERWHAPPADAVLRGTVMCTFDNGPPLDDGGHPASQYSVSADPWGFIAAAADDFMFPAGTPGTNCRITLVRGVFFFWNSNAAGSTPRTRWDSVYVTVYANTAQNKPSGQPTGPNGTPTGTYVASRLVPASSLRNETAVNECTLSYIVDIPVDITVLRGVKYWLSIVPVSSAPPQVGWCLSTSIGTGFGSVQGFSNPVNIPFWTPVAGNYADCTKQNPPPAGSRKDLSFILFAEEIPATSGACCTDQGGMCQIDVDALVCQQAGQRFIPGASDCSSLNPPCGTAGFGACCVADGDCAVLSAADCASASGVWFGGACESVTCPLSNGQCENALMITDGVYPFDTTNAATDGPASPIAPCTPVNQDIWYRYIATCDGTLTVSLCGSSFDTALAVYQGATCPPPDGIGLGALLGCSDDFCGTASRVSIPASLGQTYLIRVGGKDDANGMGTLTVGCVPPASGACCLPMGECMMSTAEQCAGVSGTYRPDSPCEAGGCPAPPNDNCANASVITADGEYPFDTRASVTQPPAPSCANANQDIWFSYTARCTGTLFLSLCTGTAFDASMAVYAGCTCGGPELACDNDACSPGGPAALNLPVTMGQCYLIRIGGVGMAAGAGILSLTCLPTGMGACCRVDQSCELSWQAGCLGGGEQFFADQLCSQVTCKPVPLTCCVGDVDGDGWIDWPDVDAFADALLGKTVVEAGPEMCRVDLSGDMVLDGLDIKPFVEKLTSIPAGQFPAPCCCKGDLNGDGRIDGLDVQGLVDVFMLQEAPLGSAEFCAANLIPGLVLDDPDLADFVMLLLDSPSCTP